MVRGAGSLVVLACLGCGDGPEAKGEASPRLEIGVGRTSFAPMPTEGATLEVFCGLQGLHHAYVSARIECRQEQPVEVRFTLAGSDGAVLARGGRASTPPCLQGWAAIAGVPIFFGQWSARVPTTGSLQAETISPLPSGAAHDARFVSTAPSALPCGAADP